MRQSLRYYCNGYNREELLLQWHPDKNGDLTPDCVTYGSQRKIWWKCDAGHEWVSPVYSRFGKNSGCPYCSGRKVSSGHDLLSLYPNLATQWHPTRNGLDHPEQFTPGSSKTVWWQCEKGHEWPAMIKTRVKGSNCPVCSNRVVISGVNDLATIAPILAKQWHPERNGNLIPGQVTAGSKRRVWWRCEKGHEWQAAVHARAAGSGCPVCSGKNVVPGLNDFKTHYPDLAIQWHPDRNGDLEPDQVSPGSSKRVWWRCDKGHEWQSTVASRTGRLSGCPYCSGRKVLQGFNDLKSLHPLVAAQWHPTKNGLLEPTMVSPGSTKKVWWKCAEGHEWRAVIYSRTDSRKCGCPVCAGKSRYDDGGW